jgi:hypothetical protein
MRIDEPDKTRRRGDSKPFPFDFPENMYVFAYRHIFDEGRQILYICHEGSGDWQFLCDVSRSHEAKDGMLVCLRDMVDQDTSIAALASMSLRYVRRAPIAG